MRRGKGGRRWSLRRGHIRIGHPSPHLPPYAGHQPWAASGLPRLSAPPPPHTPRSPTVCCLWTTSPATSHSQCCWSGSGRYTHWAGTGRGRGGGQGLCVEGDVYMCACVCVVVWAEAGDLPLLCSAWAQHTPPCLSISSRAWTHPAMLCRALLLTAPVLRPPPPPSPLQPCPQDTAPCLRCCAHTRPVPGAVLAARSRASHLVAAQGAAGTEVHLSSAG